MGHNICSKLVNFDRTEAGLTSKWGRILSVQWYDDEQCHLKICFTETDMHRDTGTHTDVHRDTGTYTDVYKTDYIAR